MAHDESGDDLKLRSQRWFDNPGNPSMTALYLERQLNFGLTREELQAGRPIIGIAQTGSDIAPCNRHHIALAERTKAGIRDAGGIPLEFPIHPIQETLKRPTAALDRNLAYLSLVEVLHGYPIDGVVLTTGCDKTTPACLMGAASCDLPTLAISGGAMLNGKFRGEDIGSGTNVWSFSEAVRSGTMPLCDFQEAESCMSRSTGHCMTMGTASTMASVVEALGMGMPMNAAIPAVDSRRYALSHMAGRRIVEMVNEDLRMSKILTREAFENAVRVVGAIGGSTNAVIHLLAIAGRMGVEFRLEDFDRLGREVPCLVNLMPSGKYLMEDFYYAGGVPAVIRELGDLINREALTVNGKTIGENTAEAPNWNREVIMPIDAPFAPQGGIAVLRGNLSPNGAVIKPSAATPALMKHRGRAVVFESIEDLHARIDDEELDIDETCVMVLKYCGPQGYPGMPEVGNMPLPPKLLRRGITDMVRISDARMSGTAYGTVVLHVAPEAAAGGTLALVANGDMIELDVEARRLHLDVSEEELAERRRNWQPPAVEHARGYYKLYTERVLQADQGADFDFLVGKSGVEVTRESH